MCAADSGSSRAFRANAKERGFRPPRAPRFSRALARPYGQIEGSGNSLLPSSLRVLAASWLLKEMINPGNPELPHDTLLEQEKKKGRMRVPRVSHHTNQFRRKLATLRSGGCNVPTQLWPCIMRAPRPQPWGNSALRHSTSRYSTPKPLHGL